MKFMSYVTGIDLDRYAETIERRRRLRDRRNNPADEPSRNNGPEPSAPEPAAPVEVGEPSMPAEAAVELLVAEPPAEPSEKPIESTKVKRSGSITVESDSDADISASISIKGSATQSKSPASKSVRFQEGPKSILKKTSGHSSSDCGCKCTGECGYRKDDSSVQDPTSNKQRNVSKKGRGSNNKTSEGVSCSCDATTKAPNNLPLHTRDNKQPQKHAQNYSDYIRSYNPNMSRLIHQSRAEVIIREDVVESPTDPRPNAFFDSRTGTLRVYHGPVYGNPFSTLVPIRGSQFPIGANVHQAYSVAANGVGSAVNGGDVYQQRHQPAAAAISPRPAASAGPGSAHSGSTAKGNQNNGCGSSDGQTPWSGDGWGDESNDNNSGDASNDDGNNNNINFCDEWGASNNNNNNNSGGRWGSTNNGNNNTWSSSNQNDSSKTKKSNNSSFRCGQSTNNSDWKNNSSWKNTGNETTVSAGSWGDEGGKQDDTPTWGDQSAAQSWGGEYTNGGSGW